MFSAPWRRHDKAVQDSRKRSQDNIAHSSSLANVDRSRSPLRRAHVGLGQGSLEIAYAHARILYACLPYAVRTQLQHLPLISWTGAGQPVGFPAEIQIIIATIHELMNAKEDTSLALLNWKFALARVRLKTSMPSAQVHTALGCSAADVSSGAWRRCGPTPSANLKLLQSAVSSPSEAQNILDRVLAARTTAAHSDNTHTTYGSHLKMIGWACEVIGCQPIPATLSTIQRVACLVNDASTLRGWLAAWKLAHTLVGEPWAGDLDPRMRLLKMGLTRLMPPALPRKRARATEAIAMVKYALSFRQRRWNLWAGMAAFDGGSSSCHRGPADRLQESHAVDGAAAQRRRAARV